MLTRTSPTSHHYLQNLALILLSLFFLPLDTFILAISYALRPLLPTTAVPQPQSLPPTRRKTILVTGVGMTKGLTLARLFHLAGHRVIGADFEPGHPPALVCGRVSTALARFYRLTPPRTQEDSGPYISSLVDVIQRERVSLWVSCSGVASAISDAEAKEVVEKRTACRAIQFDVRQTETLHEKDRFIARCRELGLLVPETITVRSAEEIEEALRERAQGREFIMKSIALDDASRADMTLLPRPTEVETRKHVQAIRISASRPWILQEFIRGPEFCTHALVVKGEVKAFVACPSAELLMHYKAIPAESPLSRAMLAFTRRFADAGGKTFTGHLSFDFLVKKEDLGKKRPQEIRLYPIECNPRAHTAVALFSHEVGMVDGYLSLLSSEATNGYSHANGVDEDELVTPKRPYRYYWVGHDLVTRVLLPLSRLLRGKGSRTELAEGFQTFLGHLLSWKDGTYEIWDPLPWWWLYHVYWPTKFLNSILTGRKWSRMNVSTTKMFGVE
ncbi:hypothetical protein H2201_001108 [Coniosporium apollinis]|uniref:ATP-grasp domain-containing protein n=1 Tax=Coniosporium apollinis TaxID=61459 RepID=A0ABQ9P3A7_9PEZI|nr:hypothetical protein H2201_001108 [Coniosporium apollinis]